MLNEREENDEEEMMKMNDKMMNDDSK